MAKEYVFQHYVPRTYLEAWENSSGKLRVHKKDSKKFFYKSAQSMLGENDYYTLKADKLLVLSEQDKLNIFGELTKYIIELDGHKLTSCEEFAQNYYRYDEWSISDQYGNDVDVHEIKDSVDKKRILDIEKGWHKVEGDWKQVREEIGKTMDDKSYNLNIDISAKLVNYITAQKSQNNSKKEEYREIIESLIGFLKDGMTDKEYNQIISEFTDAYFLKAIRRYHEEKEESLILKEQELMKNLHIVLYKAVSGKKYYTSDNPAFTILDTKFYKGKYAGLYFPITPDIMLALHKGDTYSYTRREMPYNMIRRVNQRVVENSNRFYIVPE